MIEQTLGHRRSAQIPAREPIAVIGIGCRFPGGGEDPTSFWQFLAGEGTAISQVPLDRWSARTYYDSLLKKPGKIVTSLGGYLDRIDHFDAAFFGISPREAVEIDPQHRGLLEVTWEALEDAGLLAHQLAGSEVGVFIGISTQEYYYLVSPEDLRPYSNVGGATSIAANRISYAFDFRGPSVIVDTACSSSLVAVHLACQSLLLGECDLALAGGVNLLLSPRTSVGFSQANMLSPDGRCWSFDARADGYVRSEGVGVVALKLLSRAEADGDPIYGVVRGSGINADGRTTGISLPSAEAQAALLRDVYHRAGVSPARVRYVEAHGTGTLAGDPVEAQALGTVLGEGRAPGDLCLIGSVKSRLGHLEPAAGVAGLVKAALCLKHKLIPPMSNSHEPNPQIPFENLGLRISTVAEPLNGEEPAVIGINSFGFGGANAHVILEEYRPELKPPVSDPLTDDTGLAYLFPLSARNRAALNDYALAYREYLSRADDDVSLADLGYSLALRRSHHAHRFAFVASSREQAVTELSTFLTREAFSSERFSPEQSETLAFVFSGMGPQWWGMGRQLLEQEPVFLDMVQRCSVEFEQIAGWSLIDELLANDTESRFSEVLVAQPCNFALQVGLAALWRSWGIIPNAVVGHSVGEVAAAYICGALTLEDASRVIYHRSRLQQQTAGTGAMLAVGLSADDARAEIEGYREKVSVAALNSPSSITLAGDRTALEQVAQTLEQRKVFCRFLRGDVPYHSVGMEPIAEELLTSLAELRPQRAETPFYSTALGQWLQGPELDAGYWWRNVREPVLFEPAVEAMLQADHRVFLEVGPHPVLANSISECFAARGETAVILSSLRREEDERATMLRTIAELYAMGFPVEWDALYRDGRFVGFPKYTWQHERYWRESEISQRDRLGEAVHPLLGHRQPTGYPAWEASISPHIFPFLTDHRLNGVVLVPAALYTETAVAVTRELFQRLPYVVTDFQIHRPFVIADSEAIPRAQVLYSPETKELRYFSRVEQDGHVQTQLHVTAKISSLQAGGYQREPTPVSIQQIAERCPHAVDPKQLYAEISGRGLHLGKTFRVISQLQWNENRTEGLALVETPDDLRDGIEAYLFHPAILDCVFQLAAGWSATADSALYLPVAFESYRVYRQMNPKLGLWVHCRLSYKSKRLILSATILDSEEHVVSELEGLSLKKVPRSNSADSGGLSLQQFQWELLPLPGHSYPPSDYLPSPTELARQVDTELRRFNDGLRDDGHPEMLKQVNDLARHYTFRAFRKMGWDWFPAQRISVEDLRSRMGIAVQHHHFLSRLLELMALGGFLEKTSDASWEVRQIPPEVDLSAAWSDMLAKFPWAYPMLVTVRNGGEALANTLLGHIQPLEVLFSDASIETTERTYSEKGYVVLVPLLLQKAMETLPVGRKVRILEVGAGTGATSAHLLPMLSAASVDYTYTDVSPVLLSRAQSRFHDYPFVTFSKFDIDHDPQSQGFQERSFDIIIASDVIHAAKDIRATLGGLRRLLMPGGLLIALEINRVKPDMLDIGYGQLPQWQDASLEIDGQRRLNVLLTPADWQSLLSESGFDEPLCLPPPLDDSPSFDHLQHVFVGQRSLQAPSPDQAKGPSDPLHTWLIFEDQRGVAPRLSALIEERGATYVSVRAGSAYRRLGPKRFEVDPVSADDIKQVFAAMDADSLRCDGVLHLFSLDMPATEGMNIEVLAQSQGLGVLSALSLMQSMIDVESSSSLWLVTGGAQRESASVAQSPLWGLGRVLLSEHPEIACRMIDLSANPPDEEISGLAEELFANSGEEEVALRKQARYVRRMRLRDEQRPGKRVVNGQPFRLTTNAPGMLQNLTIESVERRAPGPDEIEVEVHAAGLNFKDVAIALALLPDEAFSAGYTGQLLGMEYSGKVVAVGSAVEAFRAGDDVLGIAPASLSAYATGLASLAVRKPTSLSFEEAATLPGAFLTAHYTLNTLARISPGERVLIHSAAGGVGLAAVQIARLSGAEIFATIGSAEKRRLLQWLGVEHIMDSRSLSFADEVMHATHGEGVDVVLNSLAGDAIAKGLSVLRPYGRFIEIGKRDIYENSKLGQRVFEKNVSFCAVDIDRLFVERTALSSRLLHEIARDFESGKLHPLPYRVFAMERVNEAFQLMAEGRHVGKFVISVRDQKASISISPKPVCQSEGTYLVVGGLRGFGLAAAEWLVAQGARHLVLMSRSGASEESRTTIDRMERQGVKVIVVQGDVTRERDLEEVLQRIDHCMPPLRGAIHSAMVIDDGFIADLDAERFTKVMSPKVSGAWNLHVQTCDRPLDFFVLFSSCVSIMGNSGQSNYAAANAFLDALSHYRRARGLSSLTINWGVITDTGYVADHPEIEQAFTSAGLVGLTAKAGLEKLSNEVMPLDPIQVGVMPARDVQMWAQIQGTASSSRFAHLFSETVDNKGGADPSSGATLRQQLLATVDPAQRQQLLHRHFVQKVAQVFRVPHDQLDLDTTLGAYGIDSLTAVELRNWILTETVLDIPLVTLLNGPSLRVLIMQMDRQLQALVSPEASALA